LVGADDSSRDRFYSVCYDFCYDLYNDIAKGYRSVITKGLGVIVLGIRQMLGLGEFPP